MSERINHILQYIVCLVFLTGCQDPMIPMAYMPKPSLAEKSITGSWIVMTVQQDLPISPTAEFSGELIAIENDTVYLLTRSAFLKIRQSTVSTAILYPFRPQGATAPIIAGLSLLPNMIGAIAMPDPGAAILLIGIPVAVTATIMGLNEHFGNRLRYPLKYNLNDLGKFARFPQGLPPGLDPANLRLK